MAYYKKYVINIAGFIVALVLSLPGLFFAICQYMYHAPYSINADGVEVSFSHIPTCVRDTLICIQEYHLRNNKYELDTIDRNRPQLKNIYIEPGSEEYYLNRISLLWFEPAAFELIPMNQIYYQHNERLFRVLDEKNTIYLPANIGVPIIIDGDEIYIPQERIWPLSSGTFYDIQDFQLDKLKFMKYSLSELRKTNNKFKFYTTLNLEYWKKNLMN